MIIRFFNKNQIKILIDEIDLKNANISVKNLISNSHQTVSYIKLLLNSQPYLSEDIILTDYFIYTYHFHVFSIFISFETISQKENET